MVPRDFFQNFGVPISRGSLSQLPRWVFLGQYYPLKGPRCIKTPRVFKTIKLFCTDDRLQLIITFLESIRIHQNQNKMVKWTSRYCPILKLLETVEDFAFHKHNYHSVSCGQNEKNNVTFNIQLPPFKNKNGLTFAFWALSGPQTAFLGFRLLNKPVPLVAKTKK